MLRKALLGVLTAVALVSCSPRFAAMSGDVYSGPLPVARLQGHRMMIFRWEYRDETVSRGEGTIRMAAPDSARVDLFLAGGFGAAHAILIGDGPARTTAGESLTDILPAAPILWSAVGRLALPPAADTAARLANGRVTIEVGTDEVWRASFEGERLVQVEHGRNGTLLGRVTRGADGAVTYTRGKTILRISEVREVNAEPFDPDIWRN